MTLPGTCTSGTGWRQLIAADADAAAALCDAVRRLERSVDTDDSWNNTATCNHCRSGNVRRQLDMSSCHTDSTLAVTCCCSCRHLGSYSHYTRSVDFIHKAINKNLFQRRYFLAPFPPFPFILPPFSFPSSSPSS